MKPQIYGSYYTQNQYNKPARHTSENEFRQDNAEAIGYQAFKQNVCTIGLEKTNQLLRTLRTDMTITVIQSLSDFVRMM